MRPMLEERGERGNSALRHRHRTPQALGLLLRGAAVSVEADERGVHTQYQTQEQETVLRALVHAHKAHVRLDLHELDGVRPAHVVGARGGEHPERFSELGVPWLQRRLLQQRAELSAQLLRLKLVRLEVPAVLQVPQQVGAQSFPCASCSATR